MGGKALSLHSCRTGDATGMAAPGGRTPQTLQGTEAKKSREPDWPLLQGPGPRGGPGPRAWVRKAICRAPTARGLQDMTGGSPPGSRHNTRKKTSPSRNKGQNVIQPSTLRWALGGRSASRPIPAGTSWASELRRRRKALPGPSQSCVDSLEVPETHWGVNDFEKLAAMNALAS